MSSHRLKKIGFRLPRLFPGITSAPQARKFWDFRLQTWVLKPPQAQILGSGRSGGGGECGELTSAEKSRDWRGINFGDLEKSRGISANYPLLRGGVINLISPVKHHFQRF